jgi:hypothetical protein
MSEEPTGGEGSSPARAGEAARALMASEKLVSQEQSGPGAKSNSG